MANKKTKTVAVAPMANELAQAWTKISDLADDIFYLEVGLFCLSFAILIGMVREK